MRQITPSERVFVEQLVMLIVSAAQRHLSVDEFEKEVNSACAEFKKNGRPS